MNIFSHPRPGRSAGVRRTLSIFATSGLILAAPAWADQSSASAAVTRADAKVEMVTRQAGQAGDKGDQSFNMARERLAAAHLALKDDHYDQAAMLADEASLLAELTGERASLAALQTSYDAMAKTVAPASLAQ